MSCWLYFPLSKKIAIIPHDSHGEGFVKDSPESTNASTLSCSAPVKGRRMFLVLFCFLVFCFFFVVPWSPGLLVPRSAGPLVFLGRLHSLLNFQRIWSIFLVFPKKNPLPLCFHLLCFSYESLPSLHIIIWDAYCFS